MAKRCLPSVWNSIGGRGARLPTLNGIIRGTPCWNYHPSASHRPSVRVGAHCNTPHRQARCFTSGTPDDSHKPRSPYAVLQLRTSATKHDIKAAFRRLAKKYHPDLNPTHSIKESEARMAELIEAYDRLMDDDFGGRIGDSRVALACEMYTIAELRMDRLHDVHSLKLKLVDDGMELGQSSHAKIEHPDAERASTDLSTHSLLEIRPTQMTPYRISSEISNLCSGPSGDYPIDGRIEMGSPRDGSWLPTVMDPF